MSTITKVRMTGTDAIVAAVPTLLGFHPTDSAVVIALDGPEKHVKFAARTDLPSGDTWDQQALATLTAATVQHADAAIVVTYGGRRGTRALTSALNEAGVTVIEVIHTGNAPADENPELAAAAALRGRATLPSRAAVADTVAFHDIPRGCNPTGVDVLDKIVTTEGRDTYLAEHIKDAALLPTLCAATQATPDIHPAAANLLAITAAIAYRAGDGALANAAIERAHAIQPQHTLTYLIGQVIRSGIVPEALDSLTTINR